MPKAKDGALDHTCVKHFFGELKKDTTAHCFWRSAPGGGSLAHIMPCSFSWLFSCISEFVLRDFLRNLPGRKMFAFGARHVRATEAILLEKQKVGSPLWALSSLPGNMAVQEGPVG